MNSQTSIRIGADVGGTFTDIIAMDTQGSIWTHKVPSTPPNYEQAVLRAIEYLLRIAPMGEEEQTPLSRSRTVRAGEGLGVGAPVAEVAHGTTVATNAVLEQRGAHTALITTRGFRDVLELRRIRAPQMYDLFFEKPKVLIERYLRFELTERISATGEVLIPIAESELWQLKDKLEKERVESIAVCLLHAYAFPQHEIIVGEFLREHFPQIPISLSCEVLRERKEYERTATTVVNAYVRPMMQGYLKAMRGGLHSLGIEAPLLIMQSAGGLTPAEDAAVRPVYVLESGPAAGVLAAGHIAQRLGIDNVITLDVGGTTAKASMIEAGSIAYSPEYEVGASLSAGNRLVGGGGDRVRAPTIDIAEVGSGGGSLAYLDRAGGLRVGPRSAGAVPGPACYQRGGHEPTVTDANVVLGYIRPGQLADGEINIDLEAAQRAIHDHIAAPMGIDLLQAAEGIHRIANARTMRALRAVSTERGRDPRDFVLMAFGGSGPIHAAHLALELHLRQIIVPPLPGLFSALGLLFAGIEHHDVRSCLLSGETLNAETLQQIKEDMRHKLLYQFESEGFSADQVTFSTSVDVRFQGQASEIRIPLQDEGGTPSDAGRTGMKDERVTDSSFIPSTPQRTLSGQALHPSSFNEDTVRALVATFEEEHERLYGHRSDSDNPVQVTAVRLLGRAAIRGRAETIRPAERLGEIEASRRAYFAAPWNSIETPVIARRAIEGVMDGPLLIDEYDSTTVVPPDMRVHLDGYGNIVMENR